MCSAKGAGHVLRGDLILGGDIAAVVAVERLPGGTVGLAGGRDPRALLIRGERAARVPAGSAVDFTRRKAGSIEQNLNRERLAARAAAATRPLFCCPGRRRQTGDQYAGGDDARCPHAGRQCTTCASAIRKLSRRSEARFSFYAVSASNPRDATR